MTQRERERERERESSRAEREIGDDIYVFLEDRLILSIALHDVHTHTTTTTTTTTVSMYPMYVEFSDHLSLTTFFSEKILDF